MIVNKVIHSITTFFLQQIRKLMNSGLKVLIVFLILSYNAIASLPPDKMNIPASYSGIIATNPVLSAFLDINESNSGDLLTLTLVIEKYIRAENTLPPDISKQSDLTEKFIVYNDLVKAVVKNGRKELYYTLLPLKTGTFELPPLKITYYDPVNHLYKSMATKPIPLKVRESLHQTGGLQKLVPAALDVNQTGSEYHYIGFTKWNIVFGLIGSVIYLILIMIQYAETRSTPILEITKRFNAKATAKRILKKAERLNRENTALTQIMVIVAMRKYMEDRFGAQGRTLTPIDVKRLLNNNNIDQELVEKFHELFERNFNAYYNNQPYDFMETDIKSAYEIICAVNSQSSRINKLIPEQGEKSKTEFNKSKFLYLLLLLLPFLIIVHICSPLSFNSSAKARWIIWNEANSIMASARTDQDFIRAIDRYSKLISMGVRNGHLFYNMSLALLKAKQYEKALKYLERTERYMGSTYKIRHNMFITVAESKEHYMPWYRYLLFWHYAFSCSDRIAIAVCSFMIFWLALTFNTLRSNRICGQIMIISLIIFVLYISSAAMSLYQEHETIKQEQVSHGVASL